MSKLLTKYERSKILGIRATQISSGAKPMVDITGLDDSYKIAEKELEMGRIPFLIERKFPNKATRIVDPNKMK